MHPSNVAAAAAAASTIPVTDLVRHLVPAEFTDTVRERFSDIAQLCDQAGLARNDDIVRWFRQAIEFYAVRPTYGTMRGHGRNSTRPADKLRLVYDAAFACYRDARALEALFVGPLRASGECCADFSADLTDAQRQACSRTRSASWCASSSLLHYIVTWDKARVLTALRIFHRWSRTGCR